jgi:uncharacterized protein YegL
MYIFLLDSSTSMRGERWNNVMKELENFLTILEKDSVLKMYSKISIITYSKDSVTACENAEPTKSIMDSIIYQGRGTNFDNPLISCYKIIENYLAEHECF